MQHINMHSEKLKSINQVNVNLHPDFSSLVVQLLKRDI